MLAPSGELLRAGLGLKLEQIKRAARSYVRDRTDQATGTAASYAVAAGLFAVAFIFLIAACFVGIIALFRWIEITHGMFWAFGAVGALLLAIAAICAGVAMGRLKRRPAQFPSLTSRIGGAIKANPFRPDRVDAPRDRATTDLAASIPLAPTAPSGPDRPAGERGSSLDNPNLQLALIAGATLLGWAVMRRRHRTRRMET